MSFIQLTGLADVQEAKTAPEGRYDLVITSASLKDSKGEDGGQNVLVLLEIENQDVKYANIFHYLALPRGKDKDKDVMMLLMIKRFFTQFGIPFDEGFDMEALVGSRAACNVKVGEFNDQPKNELVLDRLPSED